MFYKHKVDVIGSELETCRRCENLNLYVTNWTKLLTVTEERMKNELENVCKALKFRPFRPVAVPDFQINKKFKE